MNGHDDIIKMPTGYKKSHKHSINKDTEYEPQKDLSMIKGGRMNFMYTFMIKFS